jgi:hypothetical protein
VACEQAGPGKYALIVLNKTQCAAYNQQGNSDLTINNGDAIVNSNCPNNGSTAGAYQAGGSLITANRLDHYVEGGWLNKGSSQSDPPPTAVSAPIPDPLAGMTPPVPCQSALLYVPAGCNVLVSPNSGGTWDCPSVQSLGGGNTTLLPGVYYGGLKIVSAGANVTFMPGTYVFAGGGTSGGFTWNSTGTGASATPGATFYNMADPYSMKNGSCKAVCGAYDIEANGHFTLSAPTVGPQEPGDTNPIDGYRDIAIWQETSCASTFKYAGGSNTTLNGIIYIPGSAANPSINITGGGTMGAVQIIVDTFSYSGTAPLTINYTGYVNPPAPWAKLVE